MAADWSPLADDDPLPGDSIGLSDLLVNLRSEAAGIRDTAERLRLVDAERIWVGDASLGFLERRQRILPDLDLVAIRIDTACIALERFLPFLDTAQSRARQAREQARQAVSNMTTARTGLDDLGRQTEEAQRAAARAAEFPDQPPPAPQAFWSPDWQGRLDAAHGEFAAAQRLFADACSVYRDAERRCEATLGEAIDDKLADPKKRGFLGSVGHAFANIADHFTDLKKFSELLGATAAVVGVASMIPGLQFLAPVGLVTSGLKTLVDIDLAATHRKGWGEVGKDALGLALFGASRIATVAARGSVAGKAAGELQAAKFAARMDKIDDMVKQVEDGGPLLTGKTAYRFVTNRSPKLLQMFGDDKFAGRLPSWRRSLYAMRHLGLGLPEAETLRIAPTAVEWAFAAQSIDVGGAVMGSHELGKIMDSSDEEGRNER